MNSIYQFKTEDAHDFARLVGIKTFPRGNELFFVKCPYCGESTNDKKTFSINLRTGMFKCFRSKCGAHGNMITLARDFNFSLGQNADEYYRPQKRYKVFKKPTEPIIPKDEAVAYLESRGISLETVKKYQITAKDGLIVFPHFDQDGNIQTIKYRNPAPKENQSKEFFETNTKPILFGMMQCNPENKTLIVTEGQIDSLSISEAGIENAVSVPGGVKSFTWIPYCWDWMSQFEKIIIFGDHEHDKITLYSEFHLRWGSKVWNVQPEDYLDCKDANDILRKYGAKQIRKCIENATQPPIPKIIDIADVEDVDVNSIPKLRTGINKLDEVLCGGLPFGQVIVVTGKSGDGKSTLANQMIVNAINEGYKSFIYSGELPNYLLKSWLTFQAAGANYVKHEQAKGIDRQIYYVEPKEKQMISEWFRGNVWIYDNRIVGDDEEEHAKLLDLTQAVIEQKGVRVILLDNLMTAMTLEPDQTSQDKFDRQGAFVEKLAKIALKHEALIILVAHKRKMGSGDTNDMVAGSSDIVNLASIILSYERGKQEDPMNTRRLKVTKNRLFGSLTNADGILLDFDPASKRIYAHQNNGELKRHYNWEEFTNYKEYFNDTDDDGLPWEDMDDREGQ